MSVILRWFEEFPKRAQELLVAIKPQAEAQNRLETLSLLVAPALIIAPMERLQTQRERKNQQGDYDAFPEARDAFETLIGQSFGSAPIWGDHDPGEWRGASVPIIRRDPAEWRTEDGKYLRDSGFWADDVRQWNAARVLKHLRDALAHWNIATSDRTFHDFSDNATMEQFIFYRSHTDAGPWDLIAVGTSDFSRFLQLWTQYWSVGTGQEALAATMED